MKDIVIIGKGGFGREVRMLIDQINVQSPEWNFIGYYDDDSTDPIDGYPLLGQVEEINKRDRTTYCAIAIGDSIIRKRVKDSIVNPKIEFPQLIHPSVLFDSGHCNIGEGAIICSNNVLTTNIVIGDFFILNLSCTIGHDVVIENFVSIMPGVNISGDVNILSNTFIGTGSAVINMKNIGRNCIIGGGAVVVKDIPDYSVAVGNPAKVIKTNE